MGTRNLTVVYKDGQHRVAQYGQWDGYPEGQGITALNFVREMNENYFKDQIDKCEFIGEDEYAKLRKQAGIAHDQEWVTIEESDRFKKLHPQLHRDMGAGILEFVNNNRSNRISLDDTLNFASNSLFCEWCYVIDLDNRMFEVYEGFNQVPLGESERFNGFELCGVSGDNKYYPVKLSARWSFDQLPTNEDFVMAFEEKNDDENLCCN